jgi:hypothetical protein
MDGVDHQPVLRGVVKLRKISGWLINPPRFKHWTSRLHYRFTSLLSEHLVCITNQIMPQWLYLRAEHNAFPLHHWIHTYDLYPPNPPRLVLTSDTSQSHTVP